MALPQLRTLSNYPTAPPFSSGSPTYVVYAEDWNQVKKTIEQGVYGVYTASVQVAQAALAGSDVFGVTGSSTFTGAVVLSGTSSTLAVGGTLTVTGLSSLAAVNASGGITVTGGITINTNGLNVTGGITVATGNIAVTSGTVSTGGGTGIAVSTHDHTGGSAGVVLNGGTAITDATLTYAKVAAASLYTGTGPGTNTLARGVDIASTRTQIGKMADGVIWLTFLDFWYAQGAAASNTVYVTTVPTSTDLFIAAPQAGGPAGVKFDTNIDFANPDAAFAMCGLPDGIDTTQSLIVTFYWSFPTVPAGTTGIKMTMYAHPITTGAGGDTTNLDLRSGALRSNTVEYVNASTANRVLEASVSLLAGDYSAKDLLYIGAKRVAPAAAGGDAAEAIYLLGAKITYTPVYA